MDNVGREVVIIQRVLPHYRIEFFNRLSVSLAENGIRLKVMYGHEAPGTVPKTVNPEQDWAVQIENTYFSILGYEIVWQRCLKDINRPDIVIIEQANRLLINYVFLLFRGIGSLRVAYWGHGKNLQATKSSVIRNFVKSSLIKSVDWWFAYTDLSANIIRKSGYPQSQITIVDNSINTDDFKRAVESVSIEETQMLREQLGITNGKVALYCGGMYPDKKLPFLLTAAERIKQNLGDFDFILIGNGPDADIVKTMADKHAWVHYVGEIFGQERAKYFTMSDVMLMPGLVGLAIVDSFIAELPMITTDVPIHSPEIAYLQNNVNGVMTSHDIESYVDAVSRCLLDVNTLESLREGCKASASRYTLDRMVTNYTAGILKSLDA